MFDMLNSLTAIIDKYDCIAAVPTRLVVYIQDYINASDIDWHETLEQTSLLTAAYALREKGLFETISLRLSLNAEKAESYAYLARNSYSHFAPSGLWSEYTTTVGRERADAFPVCLAEHRAALRAHVMGSISEMFRASRLRDIRSTHFIIARANDTRTWRKVETRTFQQFMHIDSTIVLVEKEGWSLQAFVEDVEHDLKLFTSATSRDDLPAVLRAEAHDLLQKLGGDDATLAWFVHGVHCGEALSERL